MTARRRRKAPWKPSESVADRLPKTERDALGLEYLAHCRAEVQRLQAIVWDDLMATDEDHAALRRAQRELAWAKAQFEAKSRPFG